MKTSSIYICVWGPVASQRLNKIERKSSCWTRSLVIMSSSSTPTDTVTKVGRVISRLIRGAESQPIMERNKLFLTIKAPPPGLVIHFQWVFRWITAATGTTMNQVRRQARTAAAVILLMIRGAAGAVISARSNDAAGVTAGMTTGVTAGRARGAECTGGYFS